MLNDQKKTLQKIIITSFLLFLTFSLELIFRYTINFGTACNYSFFKIELLFIILIGFLFGFKYSFFANLTYLLIHYSFERFLMDFFLPEHSHNHDHHGLELKIFLYRFFLPYLACCLSGLFYQKKRNQLFKKWPLVITLTIISIVQIFSSILFIDLLKNEFFQDQNSSLLTRFVSDWKYSTGLNVAYSFLSVVINNLIIGVLLYLINLRLKDKLEVLDNLQTN
ncbi:Conserved hypothetical protein [Candidatus Phytoplasma australiense]|uniref:Uncharacterized protein n=2 Tax=Phytoplasma australiense TaxID=59748 RepID=B1VA99_PHYAS|nr:hypothetical protein [Candidatus Phytoplasma australiense]AGL90252.1 hypothetical protein SLY_0332 [Strawberry lethal yellows phytoplasma (CPA) str. NZSb11]CAM11872.1 Conserved hypothetical protein [Candidatus Phytoplasma australiense]